jgi:putative hydrolase of HD superfamily
MSSLVEMVRVLEPYMLKHVARQSSNVYYDEKAETGIERHETTAEHVYSTLRLADYFLNAEEEFAGLDQKHVYDLILYHDDAEILTKDTRISDREKRKSKEQEERKAIPLLAEKYPRVLEEKLVQLSEEYRKNQTAETRFVHAVDKMDSLLHELQYPNDWGPKNFW